MNVLSVESHSVPYMFLSSALPTHRISTLLLPDNTASIMSGQPWSSSQRSLSLVLVVSDGGEPPLSSTATLSLSVCVCQESGGLGQVCRVQAFLSPPGLSLGASLAILLCVLILLCKYGNVSQHTQH